MTISEKKMQIVIDNYFKSECDVNTSIRQAFEKGFRIGIKKVPSAQQENTCENTCEIARTSNDCISRQKAIDLVKDVCDAILSGCNSHYDSEVGDEVYDDILEVNAILKCNKQVKIALRNMPSAQPAQPEIIHCRECKNWDKTWTDNFPPNYHYCPMVDGVRKDNFYCADAERRTDGGRD